MDVCLLGTSIMISGYVPRFLFTSNKIEQITMFVAMGLSLSLFSLTVIESISKSSRSFMCLFLSNEHNLTTTYWILLWMLSIHIVIIIPSLLGSTIINNVFGYYFFTDSNRRSTSSSSSSSSLLSWKKLPWWIRFTLGFFHIILKNILYRGIITLCYCFGAVAVTIIIDVIVVVDDLLPS